MLLIILKNTQYDTGGSIMQIIYNLEMYRA